MELSMTSVKACGRHFDVAAIMRDDSERLRELQEENARLRERAKSLTVVITDMSKVIESLENQIRKPSA